MEEEVKQGKNMLAKMETEKRQLQERFTDLEKVRKLTKICRLLIHVANYSQLRLAYWFPHSVVAGLILMVEFNLFLLEHFILSCI